MRRSSVPDLLDAWYRSHTCEVAWTSAPERPAVVAAVPLVLDRLPCVALPYAMAAQVESLRSADRVAFTLTDAASCDEGMVAAGPVEVVDDVLGTTFSERLLGQEVAKYPPSRIYADTPLLRRENWWWLPRVIVRLKVLDDVTPLPLRTDPATDALLVRHDGHRMRLDVIAPVTGADWTDRVVPLGSPSGPLRGDGARVVALGHQHTVPDLERWESWYVRGTLRGDDLEVTDRDGTPGAELPPLGLMQRLRRQRTLERACKRGIHTAERRTP